MAETDQQASALSARNPDFPDDIEAEKLKQPVIIKKKILEGHAGAHGGAWKIALADMMTAMMAFFLLMWLLGATPESQRQGIADYFQPTNEKTSGKGETSGSNGMFGGRSIIDPEGIPSPPMQRALLDRVTPRPEAGPDTDQGTSPSDNSKVSKDAKNLSEEQKLKIAAEAEKENLDKLEREVQERMAQNAQLSELMSQVNFIREKEGLRIEIIDKANFSMFGSGNAVMPARAQALIREVAKSVANMPNKLSIKGHTDNVPFTDGSERSNWSLSIERAEATRRLMDQGGMPASRFSRIEGVAATAPFNDNDPSDPRNRRISITVLYTAPPLAGAAK